MKPFSPELAAVLGLFDWFEAYAADCNLPDSNRLARRYLIEKCGAALLGICRTEDERIEVFGVFVNFVKRRVAPLLEETLAIRRQELEDAFTAHFVREGRLSELFLDILVRDQAERGWLVCAECKLTLHDHLIGALLTPSLEELQRLHHFVAKEAA